MTHHLSIIGYWSQPADIPWHARGRPDPRDVVGDWTVEARDRVVAHLRRGPVFRSFMGWASCRICGTNVGSQERTDGVWAWPDGLEHYVEAHDVRLPEAFVAAAQRAEPALPSWVAALGPDLWLDSGESVTPVNATAERAWVVEESTWLDWAAVNTPARPARDAVTLDEARAVCGRLSHPAWPCEVDEANGRWVVRLPDDVGPATRMYLHACSATVLEAVCSACACPTPPGSSILIGRKRSRPSTTGRGVRRGWSRVTTTAGWSG